MTLDVNRIRAICFDVDGTLSDTDDLMMERSVPFIRPFRWMYPRSEPVKVARRLIMGLETPGNYLYYLLDRIGMDAFAGRVYSWMNKSLPRRQKKYRLVPGADRALAVLGQKYPLSVVSAGSHTGTHGFLESFGLQSLFKAVATSQTCEHTKPYPHPVIWAAGQMGVLPENCLMVGDTTVDIRAGRAAGAQTVGLLCGFGEEDELRRAGADLILPGPADLLDYLAPPIEKSLAEASGD